MILNEMYQLSNGVKIPKLGLGTWEIPDEAAAQAVKEAVKIGYRHMDTAQGYGNERGVGEGIRSCGIPREELFVTTKLQAFFKSYKEAKNAIEQSLQVSGLDYFDMMIIHAPQPWMDFLPTTIFLRAIWKRGVRWKKPTKQESSVQSAFQILKKLTLTIFCGTAR